MYVYRSCKAFVYERVPCCLIGLFQISTKFTQPLGYRHDNHPESQNKYSAKHIECICVRMNSMLVNLVSFSVNEPFVRKTIYNGINNTICSFAIRYQCQCVRSFSTRWAGRYARSLHASILSSTLDCNVYSKDQKVPQ